MLTPDPGMLDDELRAFMQAIFTEKNPPHLFGFAAAMAPDHCVAGALLHARAHVLSRRHVLGLAPSSIDLLLEQIASLPWTVGAPTDIRLLRLRHDLDSLAGRLGLAPHVFYRTVRRSAVELVVDEEANFADVHEPIVMLARGLVLTIGPVRVIDPHAVRLLLPSTTALSTHEEREDRARWVRQYIQRAAAGQGPS